MAGIANPLMRALLPQAQRQANRQAGGFLPDDVYHGTFHDINSFRRGTPEAAQGSNIYTSTNPEDSSHNYARLGGADVQYNLGNKANELIADIDNPDVAQAIFDSLPPQTQQFYGTPEAWMATRPDLGDAAKAYAADMLPSQGVVMPLAIRPGNIMDLTNDPTQTMMRDLPSDAGDAFAENVRDLSDYLPLREGTTSGLRNTFDDLRYGNDVGGENATARDFLSELKYSPILQGAEAVDEAGDYYNPTAEIFSRWARDMGFPTQKIDPQLEFNMYRDPSYTGTRHLITEPERLRSVNANFDPAKRSSSDLLAGAAPAGIIPTMSSPEQLEPTAEPSGVEDQGTVPNPLRPYTHTTSTVGPEMRDAENFQLSPDDRTPRQAWGRGTASAIPGGWRGEAYDYGRDLAQGKTPFSSKPNPLWKALNEIPGEYLQGFATNREGDWMNPLLLGADLVPGIGAAGRVGRTAAKQLVR